MSQAIPQGSEHPVRAYIEAKVSDVECITELRDSLYDQTGASTAYRKSQPHLTILPPFTIDKNEIPRVNELLEESGLVGRDIPITGVGVWPSIKNPRVVLLNSPINLKKNRQSLTENLRELGAVNMEDPVRPHITLFKTDNGYTIDEHVKKSIQKSVWDNRTEWKTEVKYVDFRVITTLDTASDTL